MARSKKKKGGEKALGSPLWMTTYGDMMTLLLCFFILLFSFSTIDVVKFRDVIIELQGALGVLTGGPMVLNLGDIPAKQITENPSASVQHMEQIEDAIDEKIETEELTASIETSLNERGLMIRFTDTTLFDIGSAEIKPDAVPILEVIATELTDISNYVRIEGHTDPTPINTSQYPSNWELSTARATAIIHYMVENGTIAPDRLSAAGYSFYHPVVPNNTAENRAKNRRVDVIILKTEADTRIDDRQEALEYLASDESEGIVVPADLENNEEQEPVDDQEPATDQSTSEDRQEALDYLESDESDGIVVPADRESDESEGSSETDDPVEEPASDPSETPSDDE